MKKHVKLIALIMILALGLTLCACGHDLSNYNMTVGTDASSGDNEESDSEQVDASGTAEDNMSHAASLLVTATPFRLDKKEIHGSHIYNYPLSKAYRDGIFGSITFIPIDEAPDKDRLIAIEAERVLLNDRDNGYEHYLMVRTDTKEKAKELETLYQEITSLRLKRIDSSMSCKVRKY